MRSVIDPPARVASARACTTRSLVPLLLVAMALAGCGDIQPVEPYSPITDPAALFMSLELDHGAINLSTTPPYDQLQITATPRDANGAAMVGLAAPTIRSSDTTKVWVTPDGLLQAREPANGIRVIAELVAEGNVRHADTAIVNVTSDSAPHMLDVLSLDPVGDEAVWPMVPLQSVLGQVLFLFASGRSFQPAFDLKTLDSEGNQIPGLVVEYESLDPDIATLHPVYGNVTLLQPGEARVVARTTAYGVTIADTTVFTVTLPVINAVSIQPGAEDGPPTVQPKTLTVRPGGYVFWSNLSSDSVSVTFDDPASAGAIEDICSAFGATYPAHCDSGNIAPFMSDANSFFENTRGRHFTEPGTYTFHIEPLGVTGKVVVTETLP
jgi:plastocyanin